MTETKARAISGIVTMCLFWFPALFFAIIGAIAIWQQLIWLGVPTAFMWIVTLITVGSHQDEMRAGVIVLLKDGE